MLKLSACCAANCALNRSASAVISAPPLANPNDINSAASLNAAFVRSENIWIFRIASWNVCPMNSGNDLKTSVTPAQTAGISRITAVNVFMPKIIGPKIARLSLSIKSAHACPASPASPKPPVISPMAAPRSPNTAPTSPTRVKIASITGKKNCPIMVRALLNWLVRFSIRADSVACFTDAWS